VAIDYTALLGLAEGIKVAKADYDFTRDGGAPGVFPVNSEILPAGSLVVGYIILTTVAFTFVPTGAMVFIVGQRQLLAPSVALNYVRAVWPDAAQSVPLPGGWAVQAYIANAACTAGAATIWLFYLPT
jgi:hypothetical protein